MCSSIGRELEKSRTIAAVVFAIFKLTIITSFIKTIIVLLLVYTVEWNIIVFNLLSSSNSEHIIQTQYVKYCAVCYVTPYTQSCYANDLGPQQLAFPPI